VDVFGTQCIILSVISRFIKYALCVVYLARFLWINDGKLRWPWNLCHTGLTHHFNWAPERPNVKN